MDIEPYRPERPIQELTGHLQEVNAVAVTNDKANREIVSAGEDGTFRIWKLETGRERSSALRASLACGHTLGKLHAAGRLCQSLHVGRRGRQRHVVGPGQG